MSLFSRLFGGGRAGRLRSIGFTGQALKMINDANERADEQAEQHRLARERQRNYNERLQARREESDATFRDRGKSFLITTGGEKGKEFLSVLNDKDVIRVGKQVRQLELQHGARANYSKLFANLYTAGTTKGGGKLVSPYAAPPVVTKEEPKAEEPKGFLASMQESLTGSDRVRKAREELLAEERRTAELTSPDPFTPVGGVVEPLQTGSGKVPLNILNSAQKAWLNYAQVQYTSEDPITQSYRTKDENRAIITNNMADVNTFYGKYKDVYGNNAARVGEHAFIISRYQAQKRLGKKDVDVKDLKFNAAEAVAEINKFAEENSLTGMEAINAYIESIRDAKVDSPPAEATPVVTKKQKPPAQSPAQPRPGRGQMKRQGQMPDRQPLQESKATPQVREVTQKEFEKLVQDRLVRPRRPNRRSPFALIGEDKQGRTVVVRRQK